MSTTPISVFAWRKRDAITESLLGVARNPMTQRLIEQLSSNLFNTLEDINKEIERERERGLAQRIAEGRCAVLRDWCLTHNEEQNPGHAHRYEGSSLD